MRPFFSPRPNDSNKGSYGYLALIGGSRRYTGAIRVYDRSKEPDVYAAVTDIAENYAAPKEPVDKAMIVRAIAVDADGNVSNVTSLEELSAIPGLKISRYTPTDSAE